MTVLRYFALSLRAVTMDYSGDDSFFPATQAPDTDDSSASTVWPSASTAIAAHPQMSVRIFLQDIPEAPPLFFENLMLISFLDCAKKEMWSDCQDRGR